MYVMCVGNVYVTTAGENRDILIKMEIPAIADGSVDISQYLLLDVAVSYVDANSSLLVTPAQVRISCTVGWMDSSGSNMYVCSAMCIWCGGFYCCTVCTFSVQYLVWTLVQLLVRGTYLVVLNRILMQYPCLGLCDISCICDATN